MKVLASPPSIYPSHLELTTFVCKKKIAAPFFITYVIFSKDTHKIGHLFSILTLQESFKHSEPFLALLVNFRPKNIYMRRQHFLFCFEGESHQEKSQNLSGQQGEESMI